MEAVNLERGDYLAEDGVIYPIVEYLDRDGNPCEWFHAAVIVAGGGNSWFTVDLDGFERSPLQ